MTARRRWLWGLLIGLAALLNVGFGPALRTSDTAGSALYPEQARLLAETWAGPGISAPAAVIYDVDAGQFLLERNAHQRRPPASLTKIATALVALRRLNLSQTVTVGDEVQVEGMRIGLVPGDTLTVEALLYGTLLNSGNDAAAALAVAAAGSQERFVEEMNALAAELGLQDTHFVNPHGLDSAGHYSSAYDLALLANAALANPTFAAIVAAPAKELDGWQFHTTNQLLGAYPGVDGVKTGTTDDAGECLVASATRHGHRVLTVVLGSTDRYADTRALLDFYYGHYQWVRLELPAGRLSAETDLQGHLWRYALPTAVEVLLARWESPWLGMTWQGDGQGSWQAVRFWVGSRLITEQPVQVYQVY
jgi:D-alanyl-D-alanine carboxypeptidase